MLFISPGRDEVLKTISPLADNVLGQLVMGTIARYPRREHDDDLVSTTRNPVMESVCSRDGGPGLP